MTNDILISIHPEYVRQILDGSKTVELRRTNLHLEAGQVLWIYTTAPESRIEARAHVSFVERSAAKHVWRKYRSCAGIDKERFDAYVGDREKVTAIKLERVERLESPVSLSELRRLSSGFHPPQLAVRVSESSRLAAMLRMRFGNGAWRN